MMMTLGWFVFMRSTVAPQSQQDEKSWRHPGNNRVGARPSYQYLGPDDELSTLSGVLYPELTGGPVSLDMLNSMGDSGQAFPLIQGDGVMRGSFVIEGISTTRSEFFQDGSARKIEFSIKLKRVDDNDSSLGNTLLGRTAGNLLGRLGVGKLLNTVGGKLGGAALMGAFDQFGTRLAENLGITSQLDALRQQHPAPAYQVRVDGSDVSGTLRPRLMHMTITDNRGFSADTIEIALDDSDGKLAMPRRGATLQASIGWQGGALVDKGTFKIDEVEHGGAPDVLTIRGKSADLRGGMNKLRERSWHFETIGAIVEQLAARYGLTPSVGEAFKGMMIDHIDQTNESDLAFLTRLATEQDAIATVKSGRLMFIKAGNGTTASGKPLPAITITRQDGDQHQFSVADRDAYTGVTAYWQDNKAAEKKKIEVKRKKKTKPKEEQPLPPGVVVNKQEHELLVGDSENVKELRHVYASQSNAMRAARAEWEKLQRGVAEFQITLAKGRPELYPEQPTTVRGFKPQIDEADWLLTQVVHDLTDQGYTNRLQLEVKLEELPE